MPADYVSILRIDGTPTRISMNHPAERAGFRLYQQSYDDNLFGVRLLVRYDPWGRPLSFAGYAILALGLIGLFLRRRLQIGTARPAMLVLFAGVSIGCTTFLVSPIDISWLESLFLYTTRTLRPLAIVYLSAGTISVLTTTVPSITAHRLLNVCNILGCIGFLFLSLHLLVFMLMAARWPLGCGYETMWTAAWLVFPFGLWLRRAGDVLLLQGLPLLATGFFLLVSTIGGETSRPVTLVPVLTSPLLSVHVSTIMTAYALLSLTFLLSLGALFFPREKNKLLSTSLLLLRPAIALLTIGIFLGAIWGDTAWGRYWGWDAKEVWALITLLTYAFPLHRSLHRHLLTANSYHRYMVWAFLSVLMTYFGAGYLFSGMHSYA